MKYHYQYGAIKDKSGKKGLKIALFVTIFFLAGGYAGFLTILPATGGWAFVDSNAVTEKIRTIAPGESGDGLYIPKINVEVLQGSRHAEFEGEVKTDLKIIAPALSLQVTPRQTLAASPFARLNQLRVGDEVFVDRGETRYAYRVTDKENKAKLRLETPDGAQKILAEPVGVIAWTDSGPALQLQE